MAASITFARCYFMIIKWTCAIRCIHLTFALQSELSFEYRLALSHSPCSDKRLLHSSKQLRRQKQNATVNFPLIHFDCAIAPAASGIFSVFLFQCICGYIGLCRSRGRAICSGTVPSYEHTKLLVYSLVLFLFLLISLMQALLEPCEGELGCVLWDDAVRSTSGCNVSLCLTPH